MHAPQDKEWLTAREASAYLGYNYYYFLELVAKGKIQSARHGKGNYRFRKDWLDAFLSPPPPFRPTAPKKKYGYF
jgi:excisionase family DNA binding protein